MNDRKNNNRKRVVVITGGARRLGRALVEHYAASGCRVLFTARYSFEEGVRLAQSLGGDVHCIRSSVSDRTNAGMLRRWIGTHTDRIDLLVCNASSYERKGALETMPSDFEGLLGSNLVGPFFLAQQCHDLLAAAHGSIVNIGDAQVHSGLSGFSAYLAAKAGLISITKSLAVEWAPLIRVNAVLPGTMVWPSEVDFSDTEKKTMQAQIPMDRIGTWSDVVDAISFLENSSYSTGALITIDGGRSSIY